MKTKSNERVRCLEVTTPIGIIRLEGTPDELHFIQLPGEHFGTSKYPKVSSSESYPALRKAEDGLNRYFKGENVRWMAEGMPNMTPFQKDVYKALVKVERGQVVTYGQLAEKAGHPGSARAIGRAMATNPWSILVPCHRVIGSNGSLTGYGGGLPTKKKLLEAEGVLLK